MDRPEVRYAENDGVNIAYTRWGTGSQVVVYVAPWVSNVELYWELEEEARARRRGGGYITTIEIDKRGVGCSDRTDQPPTLDDRVSDTLAVLDAEGIRRASFMGVSEAAATAIALANRHPDRVDRIAVAGAALPGVASAELMRHREPGDPQPYGLQPIEAVMDSWGRDPRPSIEIFTPSAVGNQRVLEWTARYQRLSASPGALKRHLDSAMSARIDDELDGVRCPVMIGHARLDKVVPVACARYLAARLPQAELHIWDHGDHAMNYTPRWAEIQDDLLEFLTGVRPAPEVTTRFAVVAFTDIVDSTTGARRMGDDEWARLVHAHDAITDRTAGEWGGRRVKSTGDGALLVFDDPARALRALRQLTERIAQLGIEIRVGVHAGQINEQPDGDVLGIAVNVAARIEAVARPSQIAVSRTVTDLLMGSTDEFASLGPHALKGIEGEVEVFALEN